MDERRRAPVRAQPTLQLFRVRGVPVVVGPSWLLVALLLTVLYGPIVRDWTGVTNGVAYLLSLGFAVLFALCILAHEIGHTVVSMSLGHPVRRIVLFALGGVSEIEHEPDRARDELLIAASGPLVSVVIAAATFGGYQAVGGSSVPAVLLALLAWSNTLLAVFNLLPGLPLDGGRLLRAAVWGLGASPVTGTRVAAWTGRAVAVLVAVAGLVIDRSSAGFSAGLFSLLLAAYLWTSASQSLKAADMSERLPLIDVRQLLRPGLLIPDDLSVAEALRRVWEGHARGLVLIDAFDRPTAIVDESMIGAVPPAQRPWTSVATVARSLDPGLTVPADIDAKGLLEHMQARPAHEYLAVEDDGAPAGIIATVDFARRLQAALPAGVQRPATPSSTAS